MSAAETADPAKVIKESYVIVGDEQSESYARSETVSMGDPLAYSAQGGLLTYRGGPLRQNGAYGTVNVESEQLSVLRGLRTTSLDGKYMGFGFGTQPLIVKWYKNIREMMNINDEAKATTAMKEVIYPSNDGRIYFVDLDTQTYSREPLNVGFPMQTTASVNPYGYPLLYVGQTEDSLTNYKGIIGMRVYSLIDQSLAAFVPGKNAQAYSENGSISTSALVETESDSLIYASDNGTINVLSMNTEFDLENSEITVSPELTAYAYKTKLKNAKQYDISSSVAAYGDYVFFGDKAGSIQCVDMNTMQAVWAVDMGDSVVAPVALETGDDGEVYLYAGNVVNQRAKSSQISLVKIDALTGETLWTCQSEIKGKYASASAKAGIYAGLMGAPIVGQGDINDLVIFNVNNVVDGKESYAIVYALDKITGEEVWSQPVDAQSISSPIAMYQPDGKSYIVMGDDNGTLRLMDGYSGTTISTVNLGSAIQASPAAYGNKIVVGTTGGMLYFVELK